MTTPVEHLVTLISDALALDGRVGELGLDVHAEPGPAGQRIIVAGHVSTAERKAGIAAVVADVLRDHDGAAELIDLTQVTIPTRPDGHGEVL